MRTLARTLLYLLLLLYITFFFFFSSRRRHTRFDCDWSSDVCSSDLDRQRHAAAGLHGTVDGLAAARSAPLSRRLPLKKQKAPSGAFWVACTWCAHVVPALRSGEVLLGKLPVHQLAEEGLDELGTQVAVVDVVGVFPDVHGQQGLVFRGQGRASGAGVDDVHRTVGLLDQPGPARAEVAHGRLHEGFLEGGVAAPLLVDGVSQCAGGLAATVGGHAVPEEGVVPDLGCVVEDADRKSTRLNSSHSQISYAVFCL